MRKIAIVGTAGSGREAPYNDPSYEIWGVSARADYVSRADRWYELHRLDGEPPEWAAAWRKRLSEFIEDIPLYMLYPEPLAKTVVPYPHDEIVARFGTYFMTSTFAWMLAHAIHELRPTRFENTPAEIFICGVDMEAGSEYAQQRAGFRHFIHEASILGIAVTRLGEGGQSYEPVPYPMWQDDPLLCKLEWRKKQTTDRLAVLDKSIRANREMTAHARGELSVWQDIADPESAIPQMLGVDEKRKAVERLLVDLNSSSAGISCEIAQLEGRLDEIQWALSYLAP